MEYKCFWRNAVTDTKTGNRFPPRDCLAKGCNGIVKNRQFCNLLMEEGPNILPEIKPLAQLATRSTIPPRL